MSNQMKTGVAVAAALAVAAFFFIFNGSIVTVQDSTLGSQAQLVMQDVVAGSGPAAQPGDTVRVHYTGKFENGTVFDTSVGLSPIEFVLGTGRVIPGWDQGLVGMQQGGKRLLIIPPNLAYGANDYGPIPGNSTLIFEVELVELVPAE